jgi:hypothetical protein
MNMLTDIVTGILRGLVKVAMIAFAALFAVVVVCSALILAATVLIRFLLTGRKPEVFATVSQFRQGAQQFRAGQWAGSGSRAAPDTADVVDVQAHEVSTVLTVPLSSKNTD